MIITVHHTTLLTYFFSYLPTTFNSINMLIGGCDETWHSYRPASLCWTYLICRVQSCQQVRFWIFHLYWEKEEISKTSIIPHLNNSINVTPFHRLRNERTVDWSSGLLISLWVKNPSIWYLIHFFKVTCCQMYGGVFNKSRVYLQELKQSLKCKT